MGNGESAPKRGARAILVLFGVLTPFVALFVWGSLRAGTGTKLFAEATSWFDPLFFAYNLALAVMAVLIIPLITYLYTRNMKGEKLRRLKRDLQPKELELFRKDVEELIPAQFTFSRYVGSMGTAMLVVAFGIFIILLLKPYFPPVTGETAASAGGMSMAKASKSGSAALEAQAAIPGTGQGGNPGGTAGKDGQIGLGVDYGKGANMLLLGPFVEMYWSQRGKYYHQIVISLTAFQFGFLGAYIYFIGYLVRSYFTLDLSSHTYVAGTIRMVTSSVLALVLSFALPGLGVFGSLPGAAENERFLRFLPFLAFFLGYFPNRAIFLLDKWGNRLLGIVRTRYAGTPLARLAGMSSDHELRLDREGYDNLENLSHAKPIELAVRTGFSYRQLKQWIEESQLRLHLGNDFEEFADLTGIRTSGELLTYWQGQPDEAAPTLKNAVSAKIFSKLTIVLPILLAETAGSSSPSLPESASS